MEYFTPQERRRRLAAEHRMAAVEYMDEVTAVGPDRSTRPPGAAAAHDQARDGLTRKETP